MTGLFWFQLVIFISIVGLYLWVRKQLAQERHEWQYGTPVHEVQGEKLTDVSTAAWLWQQSGIMSTLQMLESLENALQQTGYALTREQSADVVTVPQKYIHPRHCNQIVAELLRARELFRAPNQTPEIINDIIRQSQKSGFGQKMLEDLLDDLRKRGWRLRQLRTDREMFVYPLQVAVIRITADFHAQREDLIHCLKHLATCLNETSHNGGRYCGQGMTSDVHYTILRRQCYTPPGFFPEHRPSGLPPVLTEEMRAFSTSLQNHIVILLQCTRPVGPEGLSQQLEKAIARIEAGGKDGMDEDDDTGYAFCCQGPRFPER